jgi:uncharacterized paraquat-inducible protein A
VGTPHYIHTHTHTHMHTDTHTQTHTTSCGECEAHKKLVQVEKMQSAIMMGISNTASAK